MLFYIFEDSTQDRGSRREISKSKNHLAVKYYARCFYRGLHLCKNTLLINETSTDEINSYIPSASIIRSAWASSSASFTHKTQTELCPMNHLLRPHLTPKTLSPPIQSHDARCELLLEVPADLRLTSERQRERKFARRTGIRPVLPRSLVVWDRTIVHPPAYATSSAS